MDQRCRQSDRNRTSSEAKNSFLCSHAGSPALNRPTVPRRLRASQDYVSRTLLEANHPQTNVCGWLLDKHWYCQRNEVKRLLHRISAYRRVFTRNDKLGVMLMFETFVTSLCFASGCGNVNRLLAHNMHSSLRPAGEQLIQLSDEALCKPVFF